VALVEGALKVWINEEGVLPSEYHDVPKHIAEELQEFLQLPDRAKLIEWKRKQLRQIQSTVQIDQNALEEAAHWEGQYKRQSRSMDALKLEIEHLRRSIRMQKNENEKMSQILDQHGLRAPSSKEVVDMLKKEAREEAKAKSIAEHGEAEVEHTDADQSPA